MALNLANYIPALKMGAEVDISGSIKTATDLQCDGNTTIGNASTDTCVFTSAVVRNIGVIGRTQGTPSAKTTAVTLTAAELLTGIITATHTAGATAAYTLPTGTLMDAAMPTGFGADESFDIVIINLSAALADTVTVTAGTGFTIVGEAVVESAHADSEFQSSAQFRCRKTAANTFVAYRLS